MGATDPQAAGRVPPAERLNIYAAVIYIPGPLGTFLDDLRRELVPHYNPHAHVSILPPRPLDGEWGAASSQAGTLTGSFPLFEVELTEIQLFPVTEVIYIEVGAGSSELRRMHSTMNSGPLRFDDPFPYHPHVTLAQDLPHDNVPEISELARRRWREFTGPRSFRADRVVFVQNTMDDRWVDLAEYHLK